MESRTKNVLVIFSAAIVLIFLFRFEKWKTSTTDGGDSWGYYTYLPATLIHGDLMDLQTCIKIRQSKHPHGVIKDENGMLRVGEAPYHEGKQSIKYTYGVSLFYLPAFAAAHIYASFSSTYEANGYTLPYVFSLYFITVIYVFIGLYYLRKFLLLFFDEIVVYTSLIVVFLGTNLYYFTVFNNVMSHPIQFMLWSILLYKTDAYYREKRTSHFLWMAFCVGMITVIRPTEIFALLVPVLYNFRSLRSRIDDLFGDKKQLFLGIVVGIACVIPQFLYWKYVTGLWFYNSYTTEGFDFSNPQILRGMFGFLNGWIPYSPLMILCFPGIYRAYKKQLPNTLLFITLLGLHIYIIFSWWNWFYINGFGMRAMVDVYPLWSYFLCAGVSLIISKLKPMYLYVLIGIGVILNIFQVYQHSLGIMWTELSNRGYYMEAFGKTTFTRSMSVALDLEEKQQKNLTILDTIYAQDFQNNNLEDIVVNQDGQAHYQISRQSKNELMIELPYERFRSPNGTPSRYLNISIDVYVANQGGNFYDFDTMVMEYVKSDGSTYKRRYLRLNNKTGDEGQFSIWWGIPNQWNTVEGNFRISSRFKKGEKLRVFFNKEIDHCKVLVDNLVLSTAR